MGSFDARFCDPEATYHVTLAVRLVPSGASRVGDVVDVLSRGTPLGTGARNYLSVPATLSGAVLADLAGPGRVWAGPQALDKFRFRVDLDGLLSPGQLNAARAGRAVTVREARDADVIDKAGAR